jgi:hypothetical protein
VANRCEIMAGDFFATVPGGGDAYVLSNILHDWNDKRAVKILTNCRQVMAENGRVLVVDGLISEDPRHSLLALTTDLAMLVITGGRERTEAEYGQLFAAAGLRLTKVIPVLFPGLCDRGSTRVVESGVRAEKAEKEFALLHFATAPPLLALQSYTVDG